jgi:hypothetical protein
VPLVIAAQLVRREVDATRLPPALGGLEPDEVLRVPAQEAAGDRPLA